MKERGVHELRPEERPRTGHGRRDSRGLERSDLVRLESRSAGIVRYSAGRFERFGQFTTRNLVADGDTLWIGTGGQGLMRFENGRFTSFPLPEE